MEREEFTALGEAIFGSEWKTPLAAATGINRRSISHMLAGERPIPDALAFAMRRAIEIANSVRENVPGDDDASRWTRALASIALDQANNV